VERLTGSRPSPVLVVAFLALATALAAVAIAVPLDAGASTSQATSKEATTSQAKKGQVRQIARRVARRITRRQIDGQFPVGASQLGEILQREETFTINNGNADARTASCQQGEKLISGGSRWVDAPTPDAEVLLIDVGHRVDNGWRSGGTNFSQQPRQFTTYAYCLSTGSAANAGAWTSKATNKGATASQVKKGQVRRIVRRLARRVVGRQIDRQFPVGAAQLGEIVQRDDAFLLDNAGADARTVSCQQGERVISGGGRFNDAPVLTGAFMWRDLDHRADNGWRSGGTNFSGTPRQFTTYAYCLSNGSAANAGARMSQATNEEATTSQVKRGQVRRIARRVVRRVAGRQIDRQFPVGASQIGEIVERSETFTIDNAAADARTVSCQQGEKVISGGSRWVDAPLALAFFTQMTHRVDNGWRAGGTNLSGTPRQFTTYAYCLQDDAG
jgi:hypothetical protein